LHSVEGKQLKEIWLQNADVFLEKGACFCARYLLKHAIQREDRKALWLKAYQIEREFGTLQSQTKLL
jgi:transposase-like protein